jgi:hypothetical protein
MNLRRLITCNPLYPNRGLGLEIPEEVVRRFRVE